MKEHDNRNNDDDNANVHTNLLIKWEIKPFLLSCSFIVYHMLYCAFGIAGF